KTNGKENIPKKNNIPDDFLNFEESPWEFDLIVENIDIEEKFIGLREILYKPKNKLTSFNYGIIDLNDQNIQIELGTSTGMEKLADSLNSIKINYKNLDEDVLYLKRLFEKL
ncbi:191_t:CDS:2, partial [Entrophospora sp. SA101]